MITKDRDLRSGSPVWDAYKKPRIPCHTLEGNTSTDVLIVGAGISGAMMAESFCDSGLDVMIVDKRKPLSGSTSASTALLQYEIDEPLIHLMKKIGPQKAASAWRRSKLGLESLAVKIRELKIDCSFERRNTLYLDGNVLPPDKLEQECHQRNAIGLRGQMVSGRDLRSNYGIKARAAMLSWDSLACNPVQLATGFLKTAIKQGVRLYCPVDIEGLSHRKNHIDVTTTEGHKIKTRYVIFATGYEIPRYIKTSKHKIESTWALSTKPVKGIPDSYPLIWQAADPYFYGRTTHDGRMVFGGEDEEFSDVEKRDALIPKKRKALERKMNSVFPDFTFVTDHVWSGSFGGSTTGLPSIGPIPRQKNCYAVMAYGGNGITFSRIAAEIVAAQILGYNDPDEKLFAFHA